MAIFQYIFLLFSKTQKYHNIQFTSRGIRYDVFRSMWYQLFHSLQHGVSNRVQFVECIIKQLQCSSYQMALLNSPETLVRQRNGPHPSVSFLKYLLLKQLRGVQDDLDTLRQVCSRALLDLSRTLQTPMGNPAKQQKNTCFQ